MYQRTFGIKMIMYIGIWVYVSLGGYVMSNLIDYAKAIMEKYKKDNVPLLAAAQAYYYLLAIVPLLVTSFAVLPYFKLDVNEVMTFLNRYLPSGIASTFEDNIISLVQTPKGGLLTIGIIGTLWAASSGVVAFMRSTNAAYEVEETRSFIVVRLTALLLTIGLVLAFAIALLLPVFGSVIISFLKPLLGMSQSFVIILQLIRWIISILVISVILLVLYRFAPNQKLSFKYIYPGALTASLLWLVISFGFSFYVSNFGNYSATYGSLGGMIILMIWFFLTGMILMIGAEINVLYHQFKVDTEEKISA